MNALNKTLSSSSWPSIGVELPQVSSRISPSQRKHFRPRTYEADVIARFAPEGDEMVFDGTEIGPNGLFLSSQILLPEGLELWLTFPSPSGGWIEAVSKITSVAADFEGEPGMRLEFTAIGKAQWRELFRFSNK